MCIKTLDVRLTEACWNGGGLRRQSPVFTHLVLRPQAAIVSLLQRLRADHSLQMELLGPRLDNQE